MPYYSRYRRRSGYSRYRRRYPVARRRYRRRSTTSGGVSSRSRIRVRVLSEQLCTLTIPAKGVKSNVASSVPFAYHHGGTVVVPGALQCSAITSPLYQAYTRLFDQVKCDGVISKVAVTTPIGSSNAAVPALQIVTAYDRCGSFYEAAQVRRNPSGTYVANAMTYDEVLESSGSSVRSALNNSVAKLARSCWASDIQERTTFHDCSIGEDMDDNANDLAYVRAGTNPNFFCPLFYVGFQLPTTAPQEKLNISFILSQTYYFTFRNPKYGAASGTAAAASRARTLDTEEEVIDDAPQALVDMAVRAADATGTLVRTHGRSGLTPQAKKTRLLDEADRLDADARDRWVRIEELDANLQSRYGRPTTATSYPQYERDRLEMMAKAAAQRSATAESLREQAATLDEEDDALSHTDTLPLDDQI